MPSVNLRQLRDTRQIKTWLRAGETIELRDRNTVLGRIVPNDPIERPVKLPDAAARRKAICGNRVIPAVDILIEERESRF